MPFASPLFARHPTASPCRRWPSLNAWRRAGREWARTDGQAWAFIAKALLAATLALWLAYRLELPQPSTVLVTVFIVLQPQSGQVLAKSFYRILGSLAGLTFTVAAIALFAQERVLLLGALVLWIGYCTRGAARYRDFRSYGFLLAGYTACLVGLPAVAQPQGAFLQAVWRLLEIALGICCAGVVSVAILPQTTRGVLRRTLAQRLRDFLAMAHDGLLGSLDAERFAGLSARFAADSVGFESLRSASVFEEPYLRRRSGRLAALGNRLMLLNTRFHALYQLLDRLSDRPRAVRQALAPALESIAAALAPALGRLPEERDLRRLSERLAAERETLMAAIRNGRQQLVQATPAEADRLDYDTAAELLYRFAEDLHLLLGARLALEGAAHLPTTPRETFTPLASRAVAWMAGLRSALVVLGVGLFWIETAWPSGAACTLAAALISALASTSADPRRYCLQLAGGTLVGALAGGLLQFQVLPWIDGFALLLLTLTPVFAAGAWLITRPRLAGYGTGLMVWFCSAALPGNLPRYDADLFCNTYLAYLVACGVAVMAVSVLLPPSQPWVWRRLEAALRERLVHAIGAPLAGLSGRFDSGLRDLLNQVQVLTVGQPVVQRQLLRWTFLSLELGHAIIELRLEQAALPPLPWYREERAWRLAIRALGRALVRLVRQPNAANLARALTAVDHAILLAHQARRHLEPNPGDFDRSPLRRIASYLHFIRTSLLAPDSPLAGYLPLARPPARDEG
ncbi:FUSC family protein [Pseudomonas sp. MS15a(2019)]|uniref:FUSC family protein n=1 Tax=Pseudomonas sp. MS15a(2019) TaxID=2579938 RepID=UPI0015630FD4|nr:FUSC family protein [Pseudomonas sp. MS15a(2019)]NRH40741.1 FUSC family protein [Pseudomonas sp. MS15a(2019)]